MKLITSSIKNFDEKNLVHREWLVTNGLGGYAANSISGAPTRKYHSYLVAALPEPLGRTVMFNYLADALVLPNGQEIPLSAIQLVGKQNYSIPLIEFRLENGLPVWIYQHEEIQLEKKLFFTYRQNTVHISYKLISHSDLSLKIKWRPYFHFHTHDQPVNAEISCENYAVHIQDNHYEINCPTFPELRITTQNPTQFTFEKHHIEQVFYETEALRGYESVGDINSPGYFMTELNPQEKITFTVSTESWEVIEVFTARDAYIAEKLRRKNLLKQAGDAAEIISIGKLVLAADQFIVIPFTRKEDMIRLNAAGEEARTIIAGYPWFTDWGRDTMISLEGLTLATGRSREARAVLRTFAHYIKDGLIPNMFPDGAKKGLYHTADATLWFFHAINRYVESTKDDVILEFLVPKLIDIVNKHLKGTHYGIRMDSDGLLIQGQEGYALTWMDAKMGDWVVTPRRGKAVELNALWYNALRLLEKWTDKKLEVTEKCYESFNHLFWNEQGGYLYDVIEGEIGNDDSIRPNQIFSISLDHPVLNESRWKSVLGVVEKDLLTPYGLRTLSPSDSHFKPYYEGDLLSRDGAYHQGTVWPWLIGPFVDAWLKVYPENNQDAYEFLKSLEKQLDGLCLGTLCEIYDATDPYHRRGCFAQAWSVAEVLRCLVKLYPKIQQDKQAR